MRRMRRTRPSCGCARACRATTRSARSGAGCSRSPPPGDRPLAPPPPRGAHLRRARGDIAAAGRRRVAARGRAARGAAPPGAGRRRRAAGSLPRAAGAPLLRGARLRGDRRCVGVDANQVATLLFRGRRACARFSRREVTHELPAGIDAASLCGPRLERAEIHDVEAHLVGCRACRTRVVALEGESLWLADVLQERARRGLLHAPVDGPSPASRWRARDDRAGTAALASAAR